MTQWTRCLFRDVLLVSAMFTDGTHPEAVVKERLAGHDACWEFRLTIRTCRRPRNKMATQLGYTYIFLSQSCEKLIIGQIAYTNVGHKYNKGVTENVHCHVFYFAGF